MIGRNLIISIAVDSYNTDSVQGACGAGNTMYDISIHWILIKSTIILSTTHTQELKDTAGDRLRNRQTIPLDFGDRVGRWSVAPPVLA